MSNQLRAALMALLFMFGFGSNATAQAPLPTSENPATGSWNLMQPASFAPTTASVREQCDRTAAQNAADRLTPAHCVRLEQMLRASECRRVSVSDGVVFDHMNGRESGRSRVTHRVEKKLGRPDPALLCDLGDNVFAYWFVGAARQSCNNLGIVFHAPPKPVAALVPAPVNGQCGSNAKQYGSGESSWPAEGTFCAAGTPSSPSIMFPQPGSATLWSCVGQNSGATASCQATRAAAPVSVPVAAVVPEKKCEWVRRRYIVSSSSQVLLIPGLTVEACAGRVALPDNLVNLPSSVTTVSREERVCN